MTGVFDGLATTLNGVFGEAITVTPSGGAAQAVTGVFRETPIEVADDDGRPVLLVAPTLKLTRDLAVCAALKRGDLVAPARVAPRVFSVVSNVATGSPAPDGFIVFELEEAS